MPQPSAQSFVYVPYSPRLVTGWNGGPPDDNRHKEDRRNETAANKEEPTYILRRRIDDFAVRPILRRPHLIRQGHGIEPEQHQTDETADRSVK